jgi:hypothetical protein
VKRRFSAANPQKFPGTVSWAGPGLMLAGSPAGRVNVPEDGPAGRAAIGMNAFVWDRKAPSRSAGIRWQVH